jgi:hypothetical protein
MNVFIDFAFFFLLFSFLFFFVQCCGQFLYSSHFSSTESLSRVLCCQHLSDTLFTMASLSDNLLSILRAEFPKLKLPTPSCKVYNDECVFSFDRLSVVLFL